MTAKRAGLLQLRGSQSLAALVLIGFATAGQAQVERSPAGFQAKALVVASDGDMLAQAYAGEVLGPPASDTLTVVGFDPEGRPRRSGTVAVANSVVGPPASLDLTPEGRYAVVVETRGRRPQGRADAKLADLPPGRLITVVDLHDPARPVTVQRLVGRDNPIAVTISPDGKRVAVAYDTSKTAGAPLDLYGFAAGRLTSLQTPAVPGFGVDDALKNAAFAPDGSLALVYATHPRLSIVRLAHDALVRWGADVPLRKTPFEVRFSPNGRFALVNDMTVPAAGADVRGSVTSIALDAGRMPDGTPMRRVISQVFTGVMPEGLTVSPDGRWVATTNLERTAYRPGDPRQGGFASITLLRLDADGRLVRIGDYPFAGVIPEAAMFDNASRQLAVAVFDHLAPRASGGSMDFWRIAGDFQDPSRVELVPTGVSVPIARGAQSMAIVR